MVWLRDGFKEASSIILVFVRLKISIIKKIFQPLQCFLKSEASYLVPTGSFMYQG